MNLGGTDVRGAALSVAGRVELGAGSTLALNLTSAPRTGTVVPVLEARGVHGWFDTVSVNLAGVQAAPVQTREGVSVRFG
ncbi:hypothetical protein [Actinospica sp.]|uniref:hypothetical protein n=1 Tax=Actinospica sp. TaxID=1872142 RepID=UPI002C390461|nr:hypothetical protein [Actinospica sp.]HWG25610.1 hypothetical protein [Actinospica sp.]